MANYPIRILVLNNIGDMAYSASVQHAVAGDTITWSSETGAFTLAFQGNSPLTEGLQLRSGAGNAVTGTVKAGANKGCYYYSVAATFTDGLIYMDPGCPEVIIR